MDQLENREQVVTMTEEEELLMEETEREGREYEEDDLNNLIEALNGN